VVSSSMSWSSVCPSSPFAIPLLNCVLGQTGLGKSTLINTIFASHLIDSKGRFEADEPVRQTTEIHPVSHGTFIFLPSTSHSSFNIYLVITENGVRLRLNIVDTPGFGDLVNNENW
jgi:septin 3/9/12